MFQVPQPTSKNKYQITLRSDNGEIEVFLCSNQNNDPPSSSSQSSTQQQQISSRNNSNANQSYKQIPSHIPLCDPLLIGPDNNSVLKNPLRPILTPKRVRRNLMFRNCTPLSNIFANHQNLSEISSAGTKTNVTSIKQEQQPSPSTYSSDNISYSSKIKIEATPIPSSSITIPEDMDISTSPIKSNIVQANNTSLVETIKKNRDDARLRQQGLYFLPLHNKRPGYT